MEAAPPLTAVFDARPWAALTDADLGAAAAVPSMLSPGERRFYLWLAEHWATGAGAIVDLGCYVGGSTAYLAEGLRRAGRAQPIHAYDRFRTSEALKRDFLYPVGIAPFSGEDIGALAAGLLAPWQPGIALHPGEIAEASWGGEPIEILAIDAAKTAADADAMAEIFFPHLIPGRSIVVQQDYLHWKAPWIPLQMEGMADCFAPLAFCPRDTVAFLCTAPVDAAARAAGRARGRRDREVQAALAAAAARLAPLGLGARLEKTAEGLRRNPHKRRAKDFTHKP